jgi:hypothetical protein
MLGVCQQWVGLRKSELSECRIVEELCFPSTVAQKRASPGQTRLRSPALEQVVLVVLWVGKYIGT